MSTSIYLTTIGLFFGSILIAIGLHYFTQGYRARTQSRAEAAYRATAEAAAAAQAESAVALAAIRADLRLVAERMASVESILKQVG